jgi:serine/threonine protein kinase
MLADYNDKTKEWLVKRQGSYRLVERLFVENDCNDDDDDDNNDIQPKDEIDDLSELRRMIIYKLLDLNPQSRMTTLQLLKSDWMTAVDSCT